MREVCTGAAQTGGNEAVPTLFKRRPVGQGLTAFCKARPQGFDVVACGGFVQRNNNAVGRELSQVHAFEQGFLQHGICSCAGHYL